MKNPPFDQLHAGQAASFRVRGRSMSPQIKRGQLCMVEPVDPQLICAGDVVLVKVRKWQTSLHAVAEIDGRRVRLCNGRGRSVGWVPGTNIWGRLR